MSVYLTTAAKVQEVLQQPSLSGANLALVESLIAGVTAAFERELDRCIERAERTEYFDVDDFQRYWKLRGYPVTAIASVEFDSTGQFAGDESAHDATLRRMPLNDAEEYLLYLESPAACGPRVMRVTYTGGLGATTAAVIAAFPDLAMAATLEVANLYQRRSTLSIQSQGTVGADNQLLVSLNWLPLTREVVARMKRV